MIEVIIHINGQDISVPSDFIENEDAEQLELYLLKQLEVLEKKKLDRSAEVTEKGVSL
jgi:hypothetical protein